MKIREDTSDTRRLFISTYHADLRVLSIAFCLLPKNYLCRSKSNPNEKTYHLGYLESLLTYLFYILCNHWFMNRS